MAKIDVTQLSQSADVLQVFVADACSLVDSPTVINIDVGEEGTKVVHLADIREVTRKFDGESMDVWHLPKKVRSGLKRHAHQAVDPEYSAKVVARDESSS